MYNQRLKTEAQILKEMNHPNLVSFRHQYNDGSLALEAAECSLSDLIDKLTETNITIESVLFPACDISNMIKGTCRFCLQFELNIICEGAQE
jgi:serine/threonine protein kinase